MNEVFKRKKSFFNFTQRVGESVCDWLQLRGGGNFTFKTT